MRRVGVALATAVATLIPVVAAPAPGGSPTADAASDDIVAIVVEGTGFGHGRGMSQWGAYGWAVDQGRSWQWILDHYYGGTESGTVPAGERIRVRLLDGDGSSTAGVISHGPAVTWNGQTGASMYAEEIAANVFDVYAAPQHACPSSSTLTVPDGPLSLDPGTYSSDVERMQRFLDVFYDSAIGVDGFFGPQTLGILTNWQTTQSLPADGVWNLDDATRARDIIAAGVGGATWTKVGTAVPGPIVFGSANADNSAAAPGAVLGLCDGGGSVTHYRGQIEFWSTSQGNRVVNDVRVEDYLRGVVPKEISASWADAGGGAGANSVRAQAVAARSYGLQQSRYAYAQTCDSTSCQVYAGSATRGNSVSSPSSVEDARTDAAIAATAGVVRRWPAGHPSAGQIVSTEFSASNGPRTAGGAFAPVDDVPGDGVANNPNHRWTRIFDADSLAAQYGLGEITDAQMVEAASATYQKFDGVWFNDIVLTGTNGTFRQQAWDFRGAKNLPSPGFTVRVVREDTATTSMAFIGDSVGASIASSSSSELRTLIDGTFPSSTIDTVVGRCTTKTSCPGTSGVQAAAALPTGLDLVVVELGYNDWPATFADDIDAMMAALNARGVRQVAWVDMAEIRLAPGGGPYYGPSNAALAAATARWPNLTVLGWNAASDGMEQPRWFDDGVHLTPTGQAEFALWLREQMLSFASPSHWLAPPEKITLPVVGTALRSPAGGDVLVPDGVGAVALNITAVEPVDIGFATVWPCSAERPETSNLNYLAGDIVANSVIAPVSADGTVCLYSSIGTNFLTDIAGWFPDAGPASIFVGATPHRLVDTRTGIGAPAGKVQPGAPLRVQATGITIPQPGGGSVDVPAGASAVSVNFTVVGPDGGGFGTIWPCASPRPEASNINFVAGDIVANNVIAPVDGNGELCVYLSSPGDVLVDISGWFPAGAGAAGFQAAVPTRFADTRGSARVVPETPLVVPVRGRELATAGGPVVVPESATAVAMNLTIVGADGWGFGTVWPCDSPRPEASNVNYVGGDIVANGVVAPIGGDGTICVYTFAEADILVDVAGWFESGSPEAFVGTVPFRLVDTRTSVGPAPA